MKLLLVDDEPYTREGILSIIAFDKLLRKQSELV